MTVKSTSKNTSPRPRLQKQKAPQTKQSMQTSKSKPLDPTRYGDWEKNGRCIDF